MAIIHHPSDASFDRFFYDVRQANFHFLLQNPAWTIGRSSLAPPVLQEAFFDPDVLVDWDTVNTVRLFRKVSRRKEAVSSRAQEETASSARGTSQTVGSTKNSAGSVFLLVAAIRALRVLSDFPNFAYIQSVTVTAVCVCV